MLLSDSMFLLLIHFIASGVLFCFFFALNCKASYVLSYKGQFEFTRASREHLYLFFLLRSPSQEDFKMTGAGNKLEANAKDGFLQRSSVYRAKMQRRK